MAIVLIPHDPFPDVWRRASEEVFSAEGFAIWPGAPGWEAADCVVMARGAAGVLPKLKNFKLVSSTGMGVDHILAPPDLPGGVPVARLVTMQMADQVAEYAVLAVMRVERDSDRFDQFRREELGF